MNRDRAGALFVTALLLISACTAGGTEGAARSETKPARVEGVPGTESSRVILTVAAVARLGIITEPVRELTRGKKTAVPVAAVLYDEHGATWVFTAVACSTAAAPSTSCTFARHLVTVERIERSTAVLQSGPAPGTAVVTVGVAELLGAEYGVEGE